LCEHRGDEGTGQEQCEQKDGRPDEWHFVFST
jgi:hypothetical protein